MMAIVALLVLSCGGVGVFALIRPNRSTDLFEVTGASLLLGSAVTSMLLFVLGSAVHGTTLVAAVSGINLALGIIGALKLRQVTWEVPLLSRAYGALLLGAIAVVAWQALVHPLGADGLINFEFRARVAWQTGGTIPPAFFSDSSRVHMHLSYPLFVPFNQLWIYLWAQTPHQGLAKVLGAVWFAGAASILFSQLSRATRRPLPGFILLGLLLSIPMMTFYSGGAIWAWGDFPLAVTATVALLYLHEFRTTGRSLALFAVSVATLPWIKREGLILGTVLLGTLAISPGWRAELRPRALAVVPFAVVLLGWKSFTSAVGANSLEDFHPISFDLLAQNLERIPRIVAVAVRELGVWQRWALLWPLALLAWVRILRQAPLASWRFAIGINVGLLVIYGSVYLFSRWPSLPWHMLTSYPRVILAPAMIAAALIAVAFPARSEESNPPVAEAPVTY